MGTESGDRRRQREVSPFQISENNHCEQRLRGTPDVEEMGFLERHSRYLFAGDARLSRVVDRPRLRLALR